MRAEDPTPDQPIPAPPLDAPPLDAAALGRAVVRPGGLWRAVEVTAMTGSTNADLLARAAAGAAEGLVLAAEEQRAGRGRMGRAWLAPPRAALTFSLLVRPRTVPPGRRGWLPLLAGVAGALLAPILSVQIGMGEQVLIMTFVAIVIGGLGSIRGAFVGALAIGLVDTLGRAYIPVLLRAVTTPDLADTLGGGLSAIAIYVLMAVVLIWKPRGLFPVSSR